MQVLFGLRETYRGCEVLQLSVAPATEFSSTVLVRLFDCTSLECESADTIQEISHTIFRNKMNLNAAIIT